MRSSIPEWPLGIEKGIAGRYKEAAEELFKQLGSDADLFDVALNVALDCCEKARAYRWPEEAEHESRMRAIDGWNGAAKQAKGLANYLELNHGFDGLRRMMMAADESGVIVRTKGPKPSMSMTALAKFLRAFGKQPPYELIKEEQGTNWRLGPLGFDKVKRSRFHFPGKAEIVTLALIHLFRIVTAAHPTKSLTVYAGQKVATKGKPCRVAAAAFACSALGGSLGKVLANADKLKKRHSGEIRYWGWDIKGRRKIPTV